MSPPQHNRSEDEFAVHISGRDARDALRLLKILSTELIVSESEDSVTSLYTSESLADRARSLLRLRALRDSHFNPALFGDPAWEILLTLLANEDRRVLTVRQVSRELRIPVSTASRWIGHLEAKGLVERHSYLGDRRAQILRLTARAREALHAVLAEA